MPVESCGNGKWRIGDGPCMYTSEANANEAYRAYLASENDKKELMIYSYKNLALEIKDVDVKQGIVTGYFSAFDVKDSDGDIIRPGSFYRSIKEWFPKGRIKHLLNHNPTQAIGKLTELKEDDYGLYYESKIGKHNLGQDFLKMVDSELIKEHSIGFQTINKRKIEGAIEITDVKLWEGSSLTSWGANEFTPLTSVKSMVDIDTHLKRLEKFVRNTDATDEAIDMCLLEIKQLYQLVHDLSSKPAAEEAPVQQKDAGLEDAINYLILKHF